MITPADERIRLFKRLDVESSPRGCWLWIGSTKRFGHGRFDARRLAHRVAYTLLVGPIPDGLCVLHRCDVPRCCNPDHLFLGTRIDNAKDCATKGRKPGFKGSAHPKARLTGADVLAIRAEWDSATERRGLAGRLGRQYGVDGNHIRLIAKRQSWKHLP